MKTILAIIAAVTVLVACHTTPGPQPPPPDASDAQVAPPVPPTPPTCATASADCLNACNTLLRIGCAEGAGNCPCVMQKLNDDMLVRDHVTGFAVTCASVETWKTKDDVSNHTNWPCNPL